jgi:LmbE family N-acetylglucosaminyl deacetylase
MIGQHKTSDLLGSMLGEERLIPYQTTDLTGTKVLVLAPHPDDETIGCGGSLCLHRKAKDPVKIIFLTNGAKGDLTGKREKETIVAMRKREAIEACEEMGVTDLEFWGFEDRGLAEADGVLAYIIDLLKTFRPGVVYSPSLWEFHPDHRAASFLLCKAASRCAFDFDILFYEVGQPLRPNCLVDITPVLDTKLRATQAYRSQLEIKPYGEIISALNRFRSLTLSSSVTHAEAFRCWNTSTVKHADFKGLLFEDLSLLAPQIGNPRPGELPDTRLTFARRLKKWFSPW